LVSTVLGIFCVQTHESVVANGSSVSEESSLLQAEGGEDNDDVEDPMQVMKRGFFVSFLFSMLSIWLTCYFLLNVPEAPRAWIHFGICGTIGLLTSVAIVLLTEYYTDYWYAPVRRIAEAATSGEGVAVIAGLSVGMESVALPMVVLSVAIVAVFSVGFTSGLEHRTASGLFGTAVGVIGMLSTSGFVLSMDVFGPISDNAGGIAEMSGQPPYARKITDKIDATGNSTKAITKGYAVSSAALAAFLLFQGYLDAVNARLPAGMKLKAINLGVPELFVAGMLGTLLVFLFSSLAMKAVSSAAGDVVKEVRSQLAEKPGILERTETPDYAKTVSVVAKAALREMVLPGLLAVLAPSCVGLIFAGVGGSRRPLLGAQAMGAFLLVGTICGIAMALFMNNAGGAWDNAKKYVETGMFGGKNSDAHRATVVGDTVGDPFKDTCGPSLHVLIKLLSTVTLVVAPLLVPSAKH